MSRARKIVIAVIVAQFAVIAGAIALLAWFVTGRGFSAREQPTAAEVFLARQLRTMAAPATAREMQNPVTHSPDVLSEAMAHFADHCATCHANDGSGKTPIGEGLYPKPPDMRLPATQDLTDGEL